MRRAVSCLCSVQAEPPSILGAALNGIGLKTRTMSADVGSYRFDRLPQGGPEYTPCPVSHLFNSDLPLPGTLRYVGRDASNTRQQNGYTQREPTLAMRHSDHTTTSGRAKGSVIAFGTRKKISLAPFVSPSPRGTEMFCKREEMDRLVHKQRRLSMTGEAAWIPAPLTSQNDPWVTEENGLFYKAARGRAPAQALIVYFRRWKIWPLFELYC